jgi:hypothetical protein
MNPSSTELTIDTISSNQYHNCPGNSYKDKLKHGLSVEDTCWLNQPCWQNLSIEEDLWLNQSCWLNQPLNPTENVLKQSSINFNKNNTDEEDNNIFDNVNFTKNMTHLKKNKYLNKQKPCSKKFKKNKIRQLGFDDKQFTIQENFKLTSDDQDATVITSHNELFELLDAFDNNDDNLLNTYESNYFVVDCGALVREL